MRPPTPGAGACGAGTCGAANWRLRAVRFVVFQIPKAAKGSSGSGLIENYVYRNFVGIPSIPQIAKRKSFDSAQDGMDGAGTFRAKTKTLQYYSCICSIEENEQRPGPKGHANSTFFRGVKPPAPSVILDLQL
jgi:hypothetical protein